MLSLVLLAVVIALVAATGGTVVWLVLSGLLAPEIAAIGSTVVLLGSSLALAMLLLRARARRAERELRTVRRNQSIREREPLRYDLRGGAAGDDEPDLVHPMPAPPAAEPTEPLSDEFAVGDTALWLEPVVLMPNNETVAWRALPGDGTGARPNLAALSDDARAGAELRVIEAALPMAARLDEPLLCGVSGAILSDRDAAMELRRMVDAEPARATRLILVTDPSALDELAGGRLDDLVDEGLGFAVESIDLSSLERSGAAALAERGATLALVRAADLDAAIASRPLRWLMEAGVEPVAVEVPDEDAMLRAADLGLVRFAGPAFGEPRRARERYRADASGTDSPAGAPQDEPTDT